MAILAVGVTPLSTTIKPEALAIGASKAVAAIDSTVAMA